MIGHSRVLDSNHRDPYTAKQIGRRLLLKAAQRLRRYNLLTNCVSVSVRTTDDIKWGLDETCPALDDNLGLIQLYTRLWDQIMAEIKPYRLKKVSVTFSKLQEAGNATDNLIDFSDGMARRDRDKSRALSFSMDYLSRKFGGDKLSFGASPKTMSGFVGTKIAFARIPDYEEFCE
jgi:DNA polymerase-4